MDPPPTELSTLSLHDALRSRVRPAMGVELDARQRQQIIDQTRHAPRLFLHDRKKAVARLGIFPRRPDRKSTRLNSSHVEISYAVFCLKKKKKSASMLPISLQ